MVRIWVMAARLRTLPAAIAPVLVGTSLAGTEGTFRAGAFVAALLGAIFIQVGTNLSNDYSDARRGADAEARLGPVRVTAGGLVPPRQVLMATYITFGLAVLCGAYLVYVAGPLLLAIGAASILAGVLYTGGPRPYGYEGLGEVFVFLFFGIVAVTGSYFVQVEKLEWEAFALAVPVGLIAAGLLVVNNVRDIDTDRRAGKRTLAVRLGRARTRVLFAVVMYLAYVLTPVTWVFGPLKPWLLLPWLTIPLAARGAGVAEALDEWRRLAVVPAVAAIDMALWDLESRQTNQPVWRRLGARAADPVEVNYTIAASDRAGAASEAAQARSAGFRCVKVK